MENEFTSYLAGLSIFSEEEKQFLAENIKVVSFKKGDLLIREGEIATRCYFVLKGCVRQYKLIDGEEKTTAFFLEQQAVVSYTSYIQRIPSNHTYICAEDCSLIAGTPDTEAEMYRKFPKLEAFTRSFMSEDFGKTQEAYSTFISSSPEERYRNLLKTQPELLQRVPQHQIASYLGMTPESLSRIRKRIASEG
ncbi:MAG TPA: Crp/Fnr family transcriptional regulator [Fluviicola sp.]|nr:Crp/Fnr family transcriptional regulator [Fluviicola sp.]